jgi:hypothetical protein
MPDETFSLLGPNSRKLAMSRDRLSYNRLNGRRLGVDNWAWIAAAVLVLLLIGAFALVSSDANRSTSAVVPDETTGQGARVPTSPPLTVR